MSRALEHMNTFDCGCSIWTDGRYELRLCKLHADAPDMFALLHDIREEIDGMIDIRDGEDGTPQPNWAMSLSSRIDEILEKAGAK